MGHSVNTLIVPYKKGCVLECESDFNDPFLCKLLEPESVFLGECNWQSDQDEPIKEIVLNGWKYTRHERKDLPFATTCLHGDLWVKGKNKVFFLNESQNSNADHFEMAVISNLKENIELFMKDFSEILNDSMPIEGPAIAHSWW